MRNELVPTNTPQTHAQGQERLRGPVMCCWETDEEGLAVPSSFRQPEDGVTLFLLCYCCCCCYGENVAESVRGSLSSQSICKKKKKKSHKAQTKKQLWKVQGCGSGSIISLTCCVMAVQAQHHWHRAQSVQESRLVHEWPKASFSVAVLPFFPPSSPVLTNSAETVGLTRREMSCLNGRKNMSPNWSRAMLPPWVGPCCSESTEWIIEVV